MWAARYHMFAGIVRAIPPGSGMTEKEVRPCRGANPPVGELARAQLRVAANPATRACPEPRNRGWHKGRRRALIPWWRAQRPTSHPIRTGPLRRHRRELHGHATIDERAEPLTFDPSSFPRRGTPPTPAAAPDTPDPRVRGCLRLHRVAGRPSRPTGAEPDRPGDRPAGRRRCPLGRWTDLPARERFGDPGWAPPGLRAGLGH